MKILKNISVIVFTMAVTAMFGCGGGGSSTPVAPPPTTATLKLLSAAGTVGTKIRGIEVTVVLPSGVTVKATPSSVNPAVLETDQGVVVLSGATATSGFIAANAALQKPIGIFTPATAATPATVKILVPSASDFDLGEYVTVNAVIAAGSFPKAADFALTGFIAVDLDGNVISGVSPKVTSSIVPDIR